MYRHRYIQAVYRALLKGFLFFSWSGVQLATELVNLEWELCLISFLTLVLDPRVTVHASPISHPRLQRRGYRKSVTPIIQKIKSTFSPQTKSAYIMTQLPSSATQQSSWPYILCHSLTWKLTMWLSDIISHLFSLWYPCCMEIWRCCYNIKNCYFVVGQ